MTRLALVVAMASNGTIGDRGALVWRISDDLKWFKKVTMGKPVLMGRKTFDSIGKALPGRENIVITRSKNWSAPGAVRAGDVDEAIRLAGSAAEICVIGGGEIYAQTLPRADRIYLTRVAAALDGDTRFPALDPADWAQTPAGACEKGARNQYSCEFLILDRKSVQTIASLQDSV
ncbi:MAG: dihydrofolate reductase [Amphiplicatus sp.]